MSETSVDIVCAIDGCELVPTVGKIHCATHLEVRPVVASDGARGEDPPAPKVGFFGLNVNFSKLGKLAALVFGLYKVGKWVDKK